MSTVITETEKFLKNPIANVKKLITEFKLPATPEKTIGVFLGATLSAPINVGYNIVYDMTLGRIAPLNGNAPINYLIKALIPLPLMGLVSATKVPIGNVLNGTLLGVSIANLLNAGVSFLTGKSLSDFALGIWGGEKKEKKETYDAEKLTLRGNGFADF